MRLSVKEYELSHGKRPRGRGSWAFAFDRREKPEELYRVPGSVTFTEARKNACEEARSRGVFHVEVMP